MSGPERIMVAGDWHGNAGWAQQVIWEAKTLLAAEEDDRVILHCGDFGIWPGEAGASYIDTVSLALDQADADLYFVDGNHEDFSILDRHGASEKAAGVPVPFAPSVSVPMSPVKWMWRGYRWNWHGRTWLACGGGVSLDRVIRTEGENWWPQEEITDEQEAAIIAGGPADVLVSHDRPSGVTHTFPERPSWWDPRDVARSEAHEARMQRIVDAVQPRWIIHGHLHRCYSRTCDFGYGPVHVTGLNRDGEPGNYALLHVKTMTWEMP